MAFQVRHISPSSNKLHRLFHSYSNLPVHANSVQDKTYGDVCPTSVNIYSDIARRHLLLPFRFITVKNRQTAIIILIQKKIQKEEG